MATTIHCCLLCARVLALVASPIIPTAAQKVWKLLGEEGDLAALSWEEVASGTLQAGRSLPSPTIVFAKVDGEQIADEIAKLHKMGAEVG
jgi:methionyl-tRNA synthetase